MADLILNWGDVAPYNTSLPDTAPTDVTTSVDTGGVAVDITFDGQDVGAEAFTFATTGYVAPGETFNPNSHLKLVGQGGDVDAASSPTSTTVLDFRATNTDLYTDNVQNVSFRLNDVDADTMGDLGGGGDGFEDILSVTAYDAEGNVIPVTLTPAGTATVSGGDVDGNSSTGFADQDGSVLVEIAGPVSRIEINYANGDTGEQAVLVSDVEFSTVDVVVEDLPPVAEDDTATTPEDTAVIIDVLDNDSDPEGQPLTVTGATVDEGTVVVNPDNTVTYTPPADYNGPATITYTIEDPSGQSDTGEVSVTVTPVNDAPVAVDDVATTDVGTPVTIDAVANDTDPDGDTLTITSIGTPTNGTATLNPDGTVTYTPTGDFTGDDTISYVVDDGNGGTDTGEIVVTVAEPDNEPPVAVDDTATTVEGTPVTIDAVANDTDPDGDTLTITSVGTPTNGTATLNPDGTVTYTPTGDFTGDDTIPYTIDDGNGGTDTGEIVVTVTDPENRPPVAVDDTASTVEGTPVVIDALANDTDPDGDTVSISTVGTPSNGTATLNSDGTVSYTPNADFIGDDTIPYTIIDGNGGTDTGEIVVTVSEDDPDPRIDTDVFPVAPGQQPLDPLNGNDQDPDPTDDLDSVEGTSGGDLIETGDDADTIEGQGGDDTINPGIDDDIVHGGGGDDLITDIQGSDSIYGGQGNDTINAGTNTFSDYENDDAAFAAGTPLAGLGFDRDPNQDDGRDYVEGNRGNDVINTGDDRDTIDGGGDNDTIDAGIDDDLVMGGQGDDSIIGSHGSDTLDGGQGNDYIDGSNLATLEQTDDVDVNTENDRDSIFGANGDDTLLGGDDDDTLDGGQGNDSIDGGIDEDSIEGGAGDDTLIGGQGNDTLNGDQGDDSIMGGADRDVIVVDSASDGIGDTVDGGAAGDDYDILDLTGVGVRGEDWRLVDTSPDSNGNGLDGTVEFLDDDGDVTGTMDFFEIEEIVPCFTPGTLIATPQGERLVEDLQIGDRIITRDNGIQEIRWLGRKDLSGMDLARKPHLNPVLIQKGALGNNLPEHDILVSPNHRMLVANDKTALYFEEREVLVAAKHLTGLDGVDEVEANGVGYIHFMFDQHEVVLSNGAWTESFQPGDYTLQGIGDAQREEIFELFPELEREEGLKAYGSARRSLKKHEAALLTK